MTSRDVDATTTCTTHMGTPQRPWEHMLVRVTAPVISRSQLWSEFCVLNPLPWLHTGFPETVAWTELEYLGVDFICARGLGIPIRRETLESLFEEEVLRRDTWQWPHFLVIKLKGLGTLITRQPRHKEAPSLLTLMEILERLPSLHAASSHPGPLASVSPHFDTLLML